MVQRIVAMAIFIAATQSKYELPSYAKKIFHTKKGK